MARKRNFIKTAIKRPGALTRKAKSAGMSVNAYARKAVRPKSRASAQTKRQANFYLKVLKPASRSRRRTRRR